MVYLYAQVSFNKQLNKVRHGNSFFSRLFHAANLHEINQTTNEPNASKGNKLPITTFN